MPSSTSKRFMRGLNMTKGVKDAALKELQKIPGVGKMIAEDLWDS